jgi:hypothetical protein
MNRPQPPFPPLLAVLGLLLATWFGLTQTASAVFLPPNHSDLFAANSSPAEHQENSSLPPENRVWENFGNPNEITPAEELNSLQLRWESDFGKLELASGVLSYADGNPISLSDPFGLCAESGGGVWNTLKGAGQAQWNNLNSGAAFLSDGAANALISVPQGMAFMTDQMHHVASGNFSSLGTSSYNGQITGALESMKNPYAQGNYEPGVASNLRDGAINAAMIVYGATSGSVGTAGSIDDVSSGLNYAGRVRGRGVQDPVSHNFPYSFDEGILATDPISKANGYNIFQKAGSMNGKDGLFEMGVTKDGVIDHRFFRPN